MNFVNWKPIGLTGHRDDRTLFRQRSAVARLGIFILFCILITRIVFLQVINHEYYVTASDKNRLSIRAIGPARGEIYDRNGVNLATNIQSKTASLMFEKNATEDITQRLDRLVMLLDMTQEERVELDERLADNRERDRNKLVIRENLQEEQVAKLIANFHRFPGLSIESSQFRHYPYKELYGHVVGYTGRITKKDMENPNFNAKDYKGVLYTGKSGIEKQYESLLHGERGWEQVEVNVYNSIQRILSRHNPQNGADIHLTIDTALQKVAHDAIAPYRAGAVVAINPSNGHILAFVSHPAFDPNIMVRGVSRKDYNRLLYQDGRPFFPRATAGLYPPASTVKPFFALAALQEKVIPSNFRIIDKGYYTLTEEGRKFHNWYRKGHGTVDLSRAIRVSNDTFFYQLAEKMGHKLQYKTLSKFGFGRKVSLDIFDEKGSFLPDEEWKRATHGMPWYMGDNLNIGIGQGFLLATPVQLASATATLASRGKFIPPRLLYAVNNEVVRWEGLPEHDVVQFDEKIWNTSIRAMKGVVRSRDGTAFRVFEGAPYEVAGKTGTSQVFGLREGEKYDAASIPIERRDHALFIGFAPIDDPQIAIAVIVENGGSGSKVSAPIARKVLDAFFAAHKTQVSVR